MIQFKKSELKNGIRVVSEAHTESRAVSIGVWVLTGTRDEEVKDGGISHFLEHLVFKGTKTRSAYQIVKSLEALGGDLNAFTTREYTCYHAMVLKDHWQKALDVLADLVCNMELKRDDFIVEKSVILQEIAMSDDTLEELVYDIYLEKCMPKHPLGRSILGTPETIEPMTIKQINSYYKNKYTGNNLIVSASGAIDHSEFVAATEKLLGKKPKRRFKNQRKKPGHRAFRFVQEKQVEQTHLLLGLPCSSFRDINRFEGFIVNTLLGGGMTSKLYQSVREKRGLVYSVYSSLNTFDDFGVLNTYAACEPKNIKAVMKNILSEMRRLRKDGISESDLELFKTQVKGGILLGADDIDNRMQSIAINEMIFEKYKPVEAIIEEIDQVTVKSTNEFIDKYFNLEDMGALLVGAEADSLRDWFMDLKFK